MKGPRELRTVRLLLTPPRATDTNEIFEHFAADAEVTRFLAWPRHRSIEDTLQFLALSDSEWERWPAGPYLIRLRENGRLAGSTGLAFESPDVATTGYVLARELWGLGYATEALTAMVALARDLGVSRLAAFCHPRHEASQRVLGKCGFVRDLAWAGQAEFPNLGTEGPEEVLRYDRATL